MVALMAGETVHPCPLFEGSEKRIVVEFSLGAATPLNGLRALSRAQLDAFMQQAACCIVSSRSNDELDAYVLSESSLFVYPERLMLKTCGTTELLAAVPLLLSLAAGLQMSPCHVKYSRASFLFPEKQPAPYHAFSEEVAFLHSLVGHLGGGAYVLGDALHGLQWHIYVAGSAPAGPAPPPPAGQPPAARSAPSAAGRSIEICMTDLCSVKAAQFCRGAAFVSARHTTLASGIGALLPGQDVDEYVFEPCGYSMNGLQAGGGFSTIHITPEELCSYASVELTGCAQADPGAVVAQAVAIFAPRTLTLCVSSAEGDPSAVQLACPPGYAALGCACQSLANGMVVAVHSLQATGQPPAAAEEGAQLAEGAPRLAVGAAQGAAGKLAGGCAAGAMQEDEQGSELTGVLGGVFADMAGSGVAGEEEVPMVVGDYASSMASDVAKTRPSSPEADWAGWELQQQLLAAAQPALAGLGDRAGAVAAVMARYNAQVLPAGSDDVLDACLARLIRQHGLEDPVCLVDLGAVVRLFRAWAAALPRVAPFYAVKCNNDPALLATLAALGAGFDCASDCEVDMVARLGVHPDRIVFANACKRPRDIRHAAANQVNLTTFDTACELAKLARWHPAARALLRIRADDPAARCQLGNKYGAEPRLAPALLQAAKELGVEVVGVSFHVGSGATNPEAFSRAIALARAAFDAGAALGFAMGVLDIGGGFCAGAGGALAPGRAMGGVPAAVNAALDAHFPASGGVRVIAEPGRYFAEGAATLACMVYGVRDGAKSGAGSDARDYWITDGLYGSMNALLYDHATFAPRPLRLSAPPGQEQQQQPGGGGFGGAKSGATRTGAVFGPSCDGLDTVLRDYALPELEVGDWLVFPRHGAYTFSGACAFNGMDPTPTSLYVFSEQ